MRLTTNITLTLLTALLFFCGTEQAFTEEWKLLFGLRGQWKFELGNDMQRARKDFDDSQWESIYAPSAWEDQGFPGYDGYAWYRKHFHSSSDWQGKSLALHLGNVDDVDEVYLNGCLIGKTGSFPPAYQTAYNANRIYAFSPSLLSPNGDNVLAVRVYDQELSGGILSGSIGVFEDVNAIQVDFQFAAAWKFKTGDNHEWSDPQFRDDRWNSISVPSFWETQGYPDYDGFAWYRVHFRISQNLKNQKLILLLGKIDDFDEAYLNGERIGKTGNMASRENDIPGSEAYRQIRAYTVPMGGLRANEDNVIAIRVYDGFQDGGLYAGPIGLVTREEYLKWQKHQKRYENIFDWIFK